MGARPKRMAGGTANDPAREVASLSKRRRANMSRKEVVKMATAKKRARNVVKQAKMMVAEAKKRATAVKAKNKKVKRVLSKEAQASVSAGLGEAIEKLGGKVTPVTIFAAATSAILRDGSGGAAETKAKAPYLLNAIGAAVRQLSPNLLVAKVDVVVQTASRVINEFAAGDHTAAAKAFRLVGDVAIRMISGPAIHALETATRAMRHADEERAKAVIAGYLGTVKRLVQRAVGAVRSLEPTKINDVLMPLFASTLRRVLLHAFTLDDHHKVLFGVFGRAEDDLEDDDAWEDVDDDEDDDAGGDDADGAEKEGASGAPAPLVAPPELTGELLWGLRSALLPCVPDTLRLLLPALAESSAKVRKAVLDNVSEIVTVTSARCVAEFAGYVLRDGGDVEEAQVDMLSGVLEPIAAQIVEAFRASSDGDEYWVALATLIQRWYANSKLTIFKRSAHAPTTVALSTSLGVPPQLHRHVKDPSGSAVQAGAFTPAEHEAFVKSDDALSAHYQKALPNVFELVPSTVMLARLLDKMRVTDQPGLNKALDAALIAIGNCTSFAAFYGVLPWNPYAADAPADENARWARSYLLHSVWRHVAHHDSIAFAADTFLPCIRQATEAMTQCRAEERMAEALQHQQLHEQYWRLVTGFFHFPVHFDEVAFRNIAKALVATLQPDPATNALTGAAHACCAAVHVLCSDYYALAAARDAFEEDDEDDEDEEDGEAAEREDNFGDLLLERDDDVLHPHRHHFIPAAHALRVCALISKYSKNIMPRLCNTAEALEDANGTPILASISSFAKVCAPATMESILKGIFDVGENIAAGVAAAGGTAAGAMSVQRRVILDIAVGIIPQLDARFVEAVAGIAQASITATPSATSGNTAVGVLQKKGYRILFQLFEYRLPDLAPGLAQIIGALQAAASTTLPAARKLRLKCLMWALDACKLYSPEQLVDFGLGFVDEVTISTRERSQQSRQLAMDWFEKFYGFCGSAGVTADGQPATRVLFHRVLASLAGKTPMAVAAAILVAGKLLWCALRSSAHAPPVDVSRVAGIIFGLVDHAAAEVRNSAVIFARMVIKISTRHPNLHAAISGAPAGDKESITATSPMAALLRAVAVTVSQAHVASATRTQMRQLLERILDHFPMRTVEPVFPTGSVRFLQYVDKQRRRATRLKEREAEKAEERRLVAELSRERRGGELGDDADDAALDLLGESTIAQIATSASTAKKARRKTTFLDADDAADAEDAYVLRISGEGKMQVVTATQGAALEDEERRKATADRLMRQAAGGGRGKRGAMTGPTIAAGEVNDDGKRVRTAETEDYENEELFRAHGGLVGNAGASSAVKPSAGTMRVKESQQSRRAAKMARAESDIKRGDEFAAKSALGDVKKGKVEPFAYVPLSRAMLNKRNTSQRVKRFAAVEHKALKGQKAQRVAAELRNAKKATS